MPNTNTPYNPAAHSTPTTLLPEEVFGYIDVVTLADIHRYLRETQGFAQLDRAYRRVRSLTNKAQDKWPFFDRNFKEMSSATVRNNARGEAAPGLGASTVSNMAQSNCSFFSPRTSGAVCFGKAKPPPALYDKRRLVQRNRTQFFPRPICQQTPAQQQADTITDASSREMIQPELPQPAATSIRRTRDAADDVKLETPSTSPSSHSKLNDNDSKADPIRDAGGWQDDDLSSLKKIKKPKGKGGRPSLKSSDQNEDVSVEVQTPSTPPPDQKIEEQNKSNAAATIAVLDTTSPLAAKDGTENQATSLAASTPAYILAAEADPVPSNLDRLPPNSRRAIKRKSEPVVQEGERNAADMVAYLLQRNLDTPKADEPTSRHDKKDSKLLKKGVTAETSPSNESMTTAEDKTMGGMEEKDTATIHKNTSTPARKPKKKGTRSSAEPSTRKRSAKTPKPDLLKMGLEKTTPVPVKKSSTDIEKNGTTPTSSDSTGVIMFNGTKETHTGYLELFATSNYRPRHH
ncbi:hypothetical protein J3E74DRAFT_455841 [Bipolaris maydis]|nr:hypothetical protein J3E74DRAFT_455841 [Bipolaris maydis]